MHVGEAIVKEGSCEFKLSEKVFYNPHMEFCRDFSSLAVGAIRKELRVLDAMAATGVRCIRYAKENPNVKEPTLLDIDPNACALARANARRNGVKAVVRHAEANSFLFKNSFDFIELDPFGSPMPFLYHAIRSFRAMKEGFLSVTATDTAVLCGAHPKACLKNYSAKPLNNEYAHETACRILLGCIAREAAQFNFGTQPLATLSKRHYIKTIVRFSFGAEKAVESVKSLGLIAHCPNCLWREAFNTPHLPKNCPLCNKNTDWAGPLWRGLIHEKNFLEKMLFENGKRNYGNKEGLEKTLATMLAENYFPPTYYDIHVLYKKWKRTPPKTKAVFQALAEKGIKAGAAHFSPLAFKTSAGVQELKKALLA